MIMDTERHTDITENYNCHTNGIYECIMQLGMLQCNIHFYKVIILACKCP